MQGASAAARGDWLAAVERLLVRGPCTRRDKQLWLTMLPALSALLATGHVAEVVHICNTCTQKNAL